MKSLNRLGLLGCLTTAVFLGACSSTPVAPPAQTQAAAPAKAPVAPAAPSGSNAAQAMGASQGLQAAKPSVPAYLDPANALSTQRSVYFDFDQYVVKPEGQRLLEAHGKFLAANPAVAIKVEGNADEQGGAEYNLALGQKRAHAVVKVLKTYGVTDAQMEAVSFGKEKPKALGHDEAAHAQNRRADLAYPAK